MEHDFHDLKSHTASPDILLICSSEKQPILTISPRGRPHKPAVTFSRLAGALNIKKIITIANWKKSNKRTTIAENMRYLGGHEAIENQVNSKHYWCTSTNAGGSLAPVFLDMSHCHSCRIWPGTSLKLLVLLDGITLRFLDYKTERI